MIPVDQTKVSKGAGDCMSAAVASLLELPLEKVPYFKGMGQREWFIGLLEFLEKEGYEFHGTRYPNTPSLKECPNVDGYVIASVPSGTFEGVYHSVIVDMDFRVIHDPNPNKKWQGEAVRFKARDWWMISREEANQ